MTSSPLPSILDREFLRVRSALIELAAALDRIDRDPNADLTDARRAQIRAALQNLSEGARDHAEFVQQVFSLPYRSDWRTTFEL